MDEVHKGKDGWLFLCGGTNEVLGYYKDPAFFDDQKVDAWITLVTGRATMLEARKCRYFHFFAPDKLSVFPEYYDGKLEYFYRRPGAFVVHQARLRGLGNGFVDMETRILAAKADKQTYLKTDTHWTFEGCYVAYETLCQAMGIEPIRELASRPFAEMELSLDLGEKLEPPIREKARFHSVLRNAKRIMANELVEENERTNYKNAAGLLYLSHVEFENLSSSAHNLRVLVFGDSFCEVRPHLLTGLLAETFRHVSFVWSSSFDWALIDRWNPDIVISEIAERFVNRVPVDDLDLKTAASARLQAYKLK